MSRLPSRLAVVLCAIALTAAACADGSDEAGDAPAEDANNAATSSTDSDAGAEADVTVNPGDAGDAGDTTATPVDLVAPGEQVAPVQVIGEALASMPPEIPVTEPDNDPAIGEVAPDLIGTSFDGSPVTVTADGTPRMIMFVAHWCPHCQREIPVVKALIDDGALPEGLEIVVVSTAVRDGEPNFPPQDWLEAEQWPGLIMRDSPEFDALLAFGAGGFPFSVYLDSEHRVVARSAGGLPEDIIRQIWLATAEA